MLFGWWHSWRWRAKRTKKGLGCIAFPAWSNPDLRHPPSPVLSPSCVRLFARVLPFQPPFPSAHPLLVPPLLLKVSLHPSPSLICNFYSLSSINRSRKTRLTPASPAFPLKTRIIEYYRALIVDKLFLFCFWTETTFCFFILLLSLVQHTDKSCILACEGKQSFLLGI